jgi:uncharacterized protein (TIGR02246 family)
VIDGALREWENAFNSGDTAALAALYTENATLMPPDSDAVHGRKGVQDFWQGARDNGVQQILLHLGDVELRGSDTLIEVSTATITAGGSQIPVKYVVVWTREGDGSWRLHVDMWSRTKPAELPTGP